VRIDEPVPRLCRSWIASFVESTQALESPRLFRKWAAISVIAAVLEQKVWVVSGGEKLYPNIYAFLVAHPGVGKTRSIRAAKKYYLQTEKPVNAPTSMTASSMIDALKNNRRDKIWEEPFSYNTMYITADELSAFMHKHDEEAMGVMSDFYDPQPYGQTRRGNDINIKIASPQLNLICGTTPANLMSFLPETAWGQGFCSRCIMVFSDERSIGDDFEDKVVSFNPDLLSDLINIDGLVGPFKVTADYRNAVNAWRAGEEKPYPSHPRLLHYCSRRKVHLYKLSAIASVDRGNDLYLTKSDFDIALGWLHEAEATMPDIFKAGATNADARAMEDIYHYVLTLSARGPVPERKIIAFARERIPLHSIDRVIKTMVASGELKEHSLARDGTKNYKAVVPPIDLDGNLLAP
jgi:hypothetical protein